MAIQYKVRSEITSDQLNDLFERVWDQHERVEHSSVLSRSLTYVTAYDDHALIGYVNVAWDGGQHAFLLDTSIDRQFRHQGIGTKLVEHAIADVRSRGLKWLHVDFEPHLLEFYSACGFQPTAAGLMRLN
jgi:ribosomal protein S18 acetylase RimI-like enzyme